MNQYHTHDAEQSILPPFDRHLRHMLIPSRGEQEARAIVFALLEDVGGLSKSDVLMGRADLLDEALRKRLEQLTARMAQGEPYQYVVGFEYFCGLRIGVRPGVLIPRPETEELIDWITDEATFTTRRTTNEHPCILDLGTGSGCIALALKKIFPQAHVDAWDVDKTPLRVARENAGQLQLNIHIRQQDILNVTETQMKQWENTYDIMVSNPPYVCMEEAADMETHVIDHEPALALFVPDNDPLRFYRATALLAQRMLRPGGRLYFEINRRFGTETEELLLAQGFHHVEIRQDSYGNTRFARALK